MSLPWVCAANDLIDALAAHDYAQAEEARRKAKAKNRPA